MALEESPVRLKKSEVNGKLTLEADEFARLVAEGKGYALAYSIAYSVPNDGKAAASGARLLRRPAVELQIWEYRRPRVVGTLLSIEQKRMMLASAIFAHPAELLDADGSPDLEKLKALPPHVLQSFDVVERYDKKTQTVTRHYRIKLLDKLRCIEVDNYLAGHGEDNADVTPSVDGEVSIARRAALGKARALLNQWTKRGFIPPVHVLETSAESVETDKSDE